MFTSIIGSQKQRTELENKSSSAGFGYGTYGSLEPLDGLRFDGSLNSLKMNIKGQRFDEISSLTANSKYGLRTITGDLMTSYLIKLPDDWSVRFNIGNTSNFTTVNPYAETGAGVHNIKCSKAQINTQEIYSGIGFRKALSLDEYLLRFTTTYEIGHQYHQSGRSQILYSQGSDPLALNRGIYRATHYLNLNASLLDNKSGLKFTTAYSATYSPKKGQTGKSIRHMGSLKLEYRF